MGGRAEESHTPQPMAKAFLISEVDDASSPNTLSSGAVTEPQVPPPLELTTEAGFEWPHISGKWPFSHLPSAQVAGTSRIQMTS